MVGGSAGLISTIIILTILNNICIKLGACMSGRRGARDDRRRDGARIFSIGASSVGSLRFVMSGGRIAFRGGSSS